VDLRIGWQVTPALSLFARAKNVFDSRFATFGALGSPAAVLGPGFTDPRFEGPGAPRAAWVGLDLRH
jgi:outer membrane receptor protein involved in Fe transport